MFVHRLKVILRLLCLALWLPATQHCHLEKLPGLAFLHCATDTADSDCQGDGCDTLEKGFYKTPDNGDVTVAAMLAGALSEPPAAIVAEPVAALRPEAAWVFASPRPCPESWREYSARALAVRGPSLLS